MFRIAAFLAVSAIVGFCQNNVSPLEPESLLDQKIEIVPRDDALSHPDLLAFRNRLIASARRHDVEAILRAADPDFRGCDMRGLYDLRKAYSWQDGDPSPFWSGFYDSLVAGGILSNEGQSFASNYVVSLFPIEKAGALGPESFEVLNRANVAVHVLPSAASKVIARLSHRIVFPQEPYVEAGWQRIQFSSTQSGFVPRKDLVSPIGISVQLERRHGRWRLIGISSYCD